MFLFDEKAHAKGKQLESVLVKAVGKRNLEVFYHLNDLARYFCKPRPDAGLTIGVFAVSDRKSLLQLASIVDIIAGMRIILILPDRKKKTINEGHKLQPRFVAFKDSDFRTIGAVVSKMMESAARAAANWN